MKFQKGQSVVEFAIVLPIFLLLLFSIFYFGMIFADYLMLNNVARSSAREASIMVNTSEYQKTKFQTVFSHYKDTELPMKIYTWEPAVSDNGNDYFKITYKDNNVTVTIIATLNTEGSYLASLLNNLLNDPNKEKLNLHITYTMYSGN